MARGPDCGWAQGMLSSRLCAHLSVLTLSHTRIHRKFNKLGTPICTNICHFIQRKEQITYYVHILYVGKRKHTPWNHPPQGIWVMKWKGLQKNSTMSSHPKDLQQRRTAEDLWKEKGKKEHLMNIHTATTEKPQNLYPSVKMSCTEKALRRNKTCLWRSVADIRGWRE